MCFLLLRRMKTTVKWFLTNKVIQLKNILVHKCKYLAPLTLLAHRSAAHVHKNSECLADGRRRYSKKRTLTLHYHMLRSLLFHHFIHSFFISILCETLSSFHNKILTIKVGH